MKWMYYLIREKVSKETMLVFKSMGMMWWASDTNGRIEVITKAQYETYAEFGISEAGSYAEAVQKMRLK